MSHRIEQVNELIRKELAKIIVEEIEWLDCLATLTKVKTSVDLKYATVLVSVVPSNKSGSALALLKKNVYRLQKTLNKQVALRHVPKIRFELDFTEHEAQKIEKLLENI